MQSSLLQSKNMLEIISLNKESFPFQSWFLNKPRTKKIPGVNGMEEFR